MAFSSDGVAVLGSDLRLGAPLGASSVSFGSVACVSGSLAGDSGVVSVFLALFGSDPLAAAVDGAIGGILPDGWVGGAFGLFFL